MEMQKQAANTNYERRFGAGWIFTIFIVLCTIYLLAQLR